MIDSAEALRKAQEELNCCPFCGGRATLHQLGGRGSTHGWVECDKCGANQNFRPTFEAAAAAWNKRIELKLT